MAVEKFANLAETTLASNYTSGGSSISVASAAGFPATGVFRVRLGNAGLTIFRVDSVSGTTFTGGAEANDANANSGDAVKIVASKAVAERLVQAPSAGDIWMPSGVGGVDAYGPTYKGLNGVDISGWTWTNQGTSAVNVAGGITELSPQSGASTNVRILRTTMPSRPFTIIAGFRPFYPQVTGVGGNLAGLGIGPYEVSSGKFILLSGNNFNFSTGNGANGGTFTAQQFTAPTTATTLYAQKIGGTDFAAIGLNNMFPPAGMFWIKYADDGTTMTVSYSWDKIKFYSLVSQTRVTGFTTAPDNIMVGMFAQGLSVNLSPMGWLVTWEQS